MSEANFWQHRIVRTGEETPENLLANPDNYVIHGLEQIEAMEALLQVVGWLHPVIVNEITGHVLDGHMRVALALSRSQPVVPVGYVQMTLEEERIALAMLRRATGLATTNPERLGGVLSQISTDHPALMRMMADYAEAAGALEFLGGAQPDTGAPATASDADVREPPVVIQIGDERLTVTVSQYEAWLTDIRSEAGSDPDAINAAIRARLAIDPSDDEDEDEEYYGELVDEEEV